MGGSTGTRAGTNVANTTSADGLRCSLGRVSKKSQIMCAYSQVRDDDQYLVTIDGVIATSPNGRMDIDLTARDYASACGFLRLA